MKKSHINVILALTAMLSFMIPGCDCSSTHSPSTIPRSDAAENSMPFGEYAIERSDDGRFYADYLTFDPPVQEEIEDLTDPLFPPVLVLKKVGDSTSTDAVIFFATRFKLRYIPGERGRIEIETPHKLNIRLILEKQSDNNSQYRFDDLLKLKIANVAVSNDGIPPENVEVEGDIFTPCEDCEGTLCEYFDIPEDWSALISVESDPAVNGIDIIPPKILRNIEFTSPKVPVSVIRDTQHQKWILRVKGEQPTAGND